MRVTYFYAHNGFQGSLNEEEDKNDLVGCGDDVHSITALKRISVVHLD